MPRMSDSGTATAAVSPARNAGRLLAPVSERPAAGLPGGRPGLNRRSGEPPALGDLEAVDLPVRRDLAVRDLRRVRLDVVVEDDDDLPAIVVDELLQLG